MKRYTLQYRFGEEYVLLAMRANNRVPALKAAGFTFEQAAGLAEEVGLRMDNSPYLRPETRSKLNIDLLWDHESWGSVEVHFSIQEQLELLEEIKNAQFRLARKLAERGVLILISVEPESDCPQEVLEKILELGLGKNVENAIEAVLASAREEKREQGAFLVTGDSVFELRFLGKTSIASPSVLAKTEGEIRAAAEAALHAAGETLERLFRSAIDRMRERQSERLDQFSESAASLAGIDAYVGRYYGSYQAILPFHYAPKFYRKHNRRYKIHPDDQRLLATDTHIRVTWSPDGPWSISLGDVVSGEWEPLRHYHTMGDYDCLGTYSPGEIRNAQDLIRVRDEVEILLQEINWDSIADSDPADMPLTAEEIEERMEPVENTGEGDLWTT